MQWSDEGVVLSVRSHGETAAVPNCSRAPTAVTSGWCTAGGRASFGPSCRPAITSMPRGRRGLPSNLGHFALELRKGFAAERHGRCRGAGRPHLLCRADPLAARARSPSQPLRGDAVRAGLPRRATVWPALVVRWELALLEELGFGLDLAACAATGGTTDLVYVSPKSGRAVSASAGEPYKDRLLALPAFLAQGARPP